MKTSRSIVIAFFALLFIGAVGCADAATSLLYVASPSHDSFGTSRITAYDPAANGAPAPLITLLPPPGVDSIAFDSALRLYTKNWFDRSDINIYPPNSIWSAAPMFTAYGSSNTNTHIPGLAVDSKGNIYVITLIADGSAELQPYLEAYAPQTSFPFASIRLNAVSASGIAVDSDDNIIVGVLGRRDSSGQLLIDFATLEIFPPRLAGNAPIRIVAGPNTGLDGTGGYSLTYSKVSGRIYVGSLTGNPKVLVFDSHSNGNVAPLRIITGPATGLRPFIGSIAANPVTGEIFVLSADAQGVAYITVYAQLANGNVSPLRTISDSSWSTNAAVAIAFTPPPSISINAGGGASGNFAADNYVTGGAPVSWTNPVDTSLLVGSVPPQNILQCDREGNYSYKFTGFIPDSQHTVTAYFVENYFSAPNKRLFHFYVNGYPYLQNFDVFAETGARFKAIQRSITVYATGKGEIFVQSIAIKDQSKVGAIVIN